MIVVRTFAESDRGLVRNQNEDSYLLYVPDNAGVLQRKGILAVVADGVGGGPAGKQASSMAVEILKDTYYGFKGDENSEALRESLRAANAEIYSASRRDSGLRGMATTCTAVALVNGEALLCHAGDSRAYIFRKGDFMQISEDHTLVNELVKEGIITREEAGRHPQRNIITKSLGSVPFIEPESRRVSLESEDTLLLCSDGLHGYVSEAEISSILSAFPAEEAGRRLIARAYEKGAPDNITVLILLI